VRLRFLDASRRLGDGSPRILLGCDTFEQWIRFDQGRLSPSVLRRKLALSRVGFLDSGSLQLSTYLSWWLVGVSIVVVEGHFGEELPQEEIWLQETNQSTRRGI
jgi:hypothetical protein